MATNAATLREEGFGETQRRDTWWVQPLAMATAFVVFIIYATFRWLINRDFGFWRGVMWRECAPVLPQSAYFLSPFYSPLLALPSWVPSILGPAIFVMWMPAG